MTFFLLLTMLSLEANFGVIVRHRTIVLPFLLILLAVPCNYKRRGSILAKATTAGEDVASSRENDAQTTSRSFRQQRVKRDTYEHF